MRPVTAAAPVLSHRRARVRLTDTILRLALDARMQGAQDLDVTVPELAVRIYGWHPGWAPLRDADGGPAHPCRRFQHVPRAARNAAYAALSRATRRLRERGLVEQSSGGLKLTVIGWNHAARIVGMPGLPPPMARGCALVRHSWANIDADMAELDGDHLTAARLLRALRGWRVAALDSMGALQCTPDMARELARRLRELAWLVECCGRGA